MTNKIAPLPSMDEAGFNYFKSAISQSKCYLEYGSGGSTVYAATVANVETIISIESDKIWNEDVKSSIINSNSNLFIEHCDIGATGEWGTPLNRDSIHNFHCYAFRPWDIAKNNSLIPDMVLIDGRFRVCAFLVSLLCARVGTLIFFDDYFDRPYYFLAEEFCTLHERHGRSAIFIVTKNFSYRDITRTIAQYSILSA